MTRQLIGYLLALEQFTWALEWLANGLSKAVSLAFTAIWSQG